LRRSLLIGLLLRKAGKLEKKMDLLLATRNAHKAREFSEMLGDEFQIRDLSCLTIAPINETGKTFTENAALKAIAVSHGPQLDDHEFLVAADDSGLEVDSLGGAPGIFSARYAGEKATDQANIDKLLRELRRMRNRSARFRCMIALAQAGKLLATFEGTVEGTIVDLPRGVLGFGYDPLFQPNGFDQTFGEMEARLKNQISHRAKAIAALGKFLRRGEIEQ
jgi:XTP/dITP diphosphohydrolase